jgi:hypothetical protein
MKKVILSVATLLITGLSMAQWTKTNVNDGLDEPYKICYTATNNGSFLKLEYSEGMVVFYLQGGYHCDENPSVDISFLVNNQWYRYNVIGERSSDNRSIFLTTKIDSEPYFTDFLNASQVKIRVNEMYCDSDIYSFSMAGSTSAYNFIKNK